MRRVIVAIAVVVLVTALVGYGSISAADPPDRIWVVAPGRIRVIPEVNTWRFEVCAIALERPSRAIVISELRCGSYDLLGALPTGGSHYYFLYISGPDYIYTSPIFVKS